MFNYLIFYLSENLWIVILQGEVMSQYDVYGLGNALVDIQYQVDPSFFEEMDIDISSPLYRALSLCNGIRLNRFPFSIKAR